MQVARRSDVDMNGHINNVTYIAWALETVPCDVYHNYELQQVPWAVIHMLGLSMLYTQHCFTSWNDLSALMKDLSRKLFDCMHPTGIARQPKPLFPDMVGCHCRWR